MIIDLVLNVAFVGFEYLVCSLFNVVDVVVARCPLPLSLVALSPCRLFALLLCPSVEKERKKKGCVQKKMILDPGTQNHPSGTRNSLPDT